MRVTTASAITLLARLAICVLLLDLTLEDPGCRSTHLQVDTDFDFLIDGFIILCRLLICGLACQRISCFALEFCGRRCLTDFLERLIIYASL